MYYIIHYYIIITYITLQGKNTSGATLYKLVFIDFDYLSALCLIALDIFSLVLTLNIY